MDLPLAPRAKINSAFAHPNHSGLLYQMYGQYDKILKYTESEISEMIFGAYKHSKMLLTDGGYLIDVSDVIQAVCDLADVKPRLCNQSLRWVVKC